MKKDSGITMLSLVITIIVMLILTSVTFRVVNNEGIVDKARDAVTEYELNTLRDELKIYHSKKELKSEATNYNPKGLYADYEKVIYMEDQYHVNVDENKTIYNILDSLKDSKLDGKVWIKEGEIAFDELDDIEATELEGELAIAGYPKSAEQEVEVIILYDVNLKEGQELQYKLSTDVDYQTGVAYSSNSTPPSKTISITKAYMNEHKNVIIYARIFDTNESNVVEQKSLTLTIPTQPTDIQFTSTENSITVLASGSTDENGYGIKGYMYSIDNGENWTNIIKEGTSYKFEGIAAGIEKTVIVKAVNNVGYESDSYSDSYTIE